MEKPGNDTRLDESVRVGMLFAKFARDRRNEIWKRIHAAGDAGSSSLSHHTCRICGASVGMST